MNAPQAMLIVLCGCVGWLIAGATGVVGGVAVALATILILSVLP